MSHKYGFTLIELLIAAVIIGTLAIFAMQSFRSASSDIRVEDATARAKIVAMAARRFWRDYPASASGINTGNVGILQAPNINHCDTTIINVQNLIDCGYLEYRQYAHEILDETGQLRGNFNMNLAEVRSGGKLVTIRACVTGNNQKIVSNLRYCTDGETVVEEVASN